MAEIRVARIKRYPESHGERPFGRCRDEAGHVCETIVRYRPANVLDETRPAEDLLRERPARAVITTQESEAAARVTERNAGKQVEVVLDHRVRNRLARDIDDIRAWLPE